MNYDQFITTLKKKSNLIKYGRIKEVNRPYDLYKIEINNKSKKTFIITSGFHGEEFNAPISLINIFDEIKAYSKKKKVNLIIYPCVNPSGFDLKQRYNASGQKQNNDFLRYEIKKGKFVGTLKPKEKFLSWNLIEPKIHESILLKKDIIQYKIPEGMLDLHQDDELIDDFYTYIFDKRLIYRKIMNKIKKFAKISRNVPALNFEDGRKIKYKIDNEGFIVLNDGTLTDMYFRLGTKYVITAETNAHAPLNLVEKVNKTWIIEMINLIAKK